MLLPHLLFAVLRDYDASQYQKINGFPLLTKLSCKPKLISDQAYYFNYKIVRQNHYSSSDIRYDLRLIPLFFSPNLVLIL